MSFNNSLLKDKEYLSLVRTWINDEKIKYAVPLYNLENICNIPDESLQLSIDYDVFLEMLLLRIRGETIKYASYKKKNNKKVEKDLLSEIESLEKNLSNSNQEIYEEKKNELQSIRDKTLKGNYIRSRVQWLDDQEKPTRSFCSIEHKNYIEKTAKRIKLRDGTVCQDQKCILQEFKHFYANLFKRTCVNSDEINLKNLFSTSQTKTLTNEHSDLMEGKLTIHELSMALKQTKNNKTPGIDGFPADFLKVFWRELRVWIQQALNNSYDKGTLSSRHTAIQPQSFASRQKREWKGDVFQDMLYRYSN